MNPFELATLADVTAPDSGWSPGANFLTEVAEMVAENPDMEIHEIADRAVPVYTHTIFTTLVDLCAYDEDLEGFEFSNMTEEAAHCLYQVAYRLADALREQATEGDDDDE